MMKRITVRRACRPVAQRRRGVTLLEMLAVVSLMGIVAVVAIPRMSGQSRQAKINSCHVHRGNIEVQAQLWFRNRGTWPASDLSNIGSSGSYFPDGIPVCPVDGTAYQFDSKTEKVIGHSHDR